MKIQMLQYFLDKKTAVSAEKLELTAEGGIVGDSHYGPGSRQVALIASEAMDEIASEPEKGLCYRRYKPNIAVDGFNARDYKLGTVIACGDAELEITERKECFPKDCSLPGQGIICPLQRSASFAKVIKGGTIKIGDEIKILR